MAQRRMRGARHWKGMNTLRRRAAAAAALALAALVLASCASPAGAGATGGATGGATPGTDWPAVPTGEVVAQGTVMDVNGATELCLGAIAESFPPQCSGIPLEGWSWEGVEGAESSGDVTWGAYAVHGTYDGEGFTVTQPPVMLALFDPMMIEDPTGGRPGAGDDTELAGIQEDLPTLLGAELLSSSVIDGWLWVDVVWDDGTWQRAADADYGADRVIIRSALVPLG